MLRADFQGIEMDEGTAIACILNTACYYGITSEHIRAYSVFRVISDDSCPSDSVVMRLLIALLYFIETNKETIW